MQKISFTGYIPTSNLINLIFENNINILNQAKQKIKFHKETSAELNKNEQQTNEKTQLKGRKFYRKLL